MKEGLAQMLKGGIIMDVVNAEQARIAEEAGACAVMALEKVPADIRRDGGVARSADPQASTLSLPSPPVCVDHVYHLFGQIIKSIMSAVTIPVMAKCRIGHFAEAQILESLEVDFIDESEGKVVELLATSLLAGDTCIPQYFNTTRISVEVLTISFLPSAYAC